MLFDVGLQWECFCSRDHHCWQNVFTVTSANVYDSQSSDANGQMTPPISRIRCVSVTVSVFGLCVRCECACACAVMTIPAGECASLCVCVYYVCEADW